MVSSILIRIGIGVVAATVLAAIVGIFLPSTFEIEKTVIIEASPERIHEFTGDLTRWPEWTPWLEEDPTLVVTFGATTTGQGASQTWIGGSSDGELAFTRSDPDWGLAYTMTFNKNTYSSTGSLQYKPVAGGTEVVWKMIGDNGNNIMARYFAGLMPSLIGPQFAEGLARLKLVSERADSLQTEVPES